MAFQFSDAARNGMVNAIATAGGSAPTLEIRSGTKPVNTVAGSSGTALATIVLPATWLSSATSGSASLVGTWQTTAANAAGGAGHFRIVQGGITHIQGTVSATGMGGDMTLDNVDIAEGQQVTITGFTLTAGGE